MKWTGASKLPHMRQNLWISVKNMSTFDKNIWETACSYLEKLGTKLTKHCHERPNLLKIVLSWFYSSAELPFETRLPSQEQVHRLSIFPLAAGFPRDQPAGESYSETPALGNSHGTISTKAYVYSRWNFFRDPLCRTKPPRIHWSEAYRTKWTPRPERKTRQTAKKNKTPTHPPPHQAKKPHGATAQLTLPELSMLQLESYALGHRPVQHQATRVVLWEVENAAANGQQSERGLESSRHS